MHKQAMFITTLTSVLLASSPLLQAQEISKQERTRVETIGVIGGLAIGALAGGPPGAVLSAGIGGWVSEQVLTARENKLLKQHMAANQTELQSLQEQHTELQLDLVQMQRQLEQRQLVASTSTAAPVTACCSDGGLVLHFRSNSDQVEALYEDALQQFVNSASTINNAVIHISGHADRRGPNAENLSLSQRRVSAVENRLKAMGLRNVTWQTEASGEQAPLSSTDSLETNFFDRRVELRLGNRAGTRVSMK